MKRRLRKFNKRPFKLPLTWITGALTVLVLITVIVIN